MTSWRRLKEIANKAMEKGSFDADDVRNDLVNYRNIRQNLIKSLEQMRLIREGKIPMKTWNEVKESLTSLSEDEKAIIENDVVEDILNRFYYEELKFCDCGNPEDIMQLIKDILNQIEHKRDDEKTYEDNQEEIIKIFNFNGKVNHAVRDFILNYLDIVGLLEHGGSIGGSWLTEKGQVILSLMNQVDDFEFI